MQSQDKSVHTQVEQHGKTLFLTNLGEILPDLANILQQLKIMHDHVNILAGSCQDLNKMLNLGMIHDTITVQLCSLPMLLMCH